jgi:hypothetical protein
VFGGMLVLTWGGCFWPHIDINIGLAAWEACSAMSNLDTNWAFALGLRKSTENLDRVGRSQDLPDAYGLLASSPAFKYASPNGSPYLCWKQTQRVAMTTIKWLTLFLWEFYETHRVGRMQSYWILKEVVYIVTTVLEKEPSQLGVLTPGSTLPGFSCQWPAFHTAAATSNLSRHSPQPG